MNQFELSALLEFVDGVECQYDSDNDACDYWRELESMGLIKSTHNGFFRATDAGLSIIATCESLVTERLKLLCPGDPDK